MRKIVSTYEGYTFFIEEKKCVDFITGKCLTGQEVADNIGISRSSVSQSLKRSIKKLYLRLKKKNKILSPMEIVLLMTEILEINDETQFKKLFILFNPKIKGEIKRDASKRLPN